MKTGIYLTPGAARTAYYVGALHTLMTEANFTIDVIAGSSVGALNGAYAAMNKTNLLVSIWQNWTTEEVMVNDYKAIAKGGFFWAKNFSSNEPEYRTAVEDYIFEGEIIDGAILRFNIADLTTGENRILEYPGEDVPIQKGIMAAVSVPVVFEPVAIEGHQYVDGLAIDGCLLEEMLLRTGVDRAFVLGVSPQQPLSDPAESAYRSAMAASEWNQYSEPLLAIERAREVNQMIVDWQQNQKELKQRIEELSIGETEKNRMLSSIDESADSAGFPFRRKPVEIIPIMPEEPIEMWFGDFKPTRSQRLIALGRKRASEILQDIEK